MLLTFLFILGLSLGSFLNVVSLRYKPEQKLFSLKIIGGRSRCPVCKKQLVWHELIPVISFLFQKGKCRHCGHLIALQYPIVEILGGLIFAFVPVKIINFQNLTLNFELITGYQLLIAAIWIAIFLLFLLLAIIDFHHYIIPDEINILLAVFAIILIFLPSTASNFPAIGFIGYYSMFFGSFGSVWINHAIAAILAMIFFGLVIVLSRGRGMGWGDFKLAGALGLIFGWPDILLALAASFIIGAFVSIFLMIYGKKGIKDAVPFGPFLVMGSALAYFFGFQIVNLYFNFFELYF